MNHNLHITIIFGNTKQNVFDIDIQYKLCVSHSDRSPSNFQLCENFIDEPGEN